MEDTRRLIPISIKKIGDENLWSIEIDGGESYQVECSVDEIKRVLRRIKAKDGENCGKCKSKKVNSYLSMVGDGDDELHKINVWKSKIPHDSKSFMALCENKEDIDMKKIILTKNYLVEGNIIPKGTVVEFKEKLDFLPSDIWEDAKDIKDEHERFEFVKAELEKMGNEYSDDEIEDFINKYKSELNESKKIRKISKDDMEDMITIIEETLKAEEQVDKKLFNDVIKACKENKELIGYWESMLTANDKQFAKLENKFWDLFDTICSKVKKTNVA